MIGKIIIFLCIGISCYLFVDCLFEKNINQKVSKFIKNKNEKYYEDLLKSREKSKKIKTASKLNLFHKIYLLMEQAGFKPSLLWNPLTIVLLGIVIFLVTYKIVFSIFQISLLSIFISIPAFFAPIVILSFIAESKNKKIEKVILNVLLQLKNYTQINNDILYALKEVKTIEPLQSHIKKFLLEMNSGIKFEKAIQNLKEKIPFKKFQMVFTNMQYCYLYGGDFSELMSKNYKMIAAVQNEKNHREQETTSARIVLGVLIVLDLFVYFTFIKDNYENYEIMTKSLLGNVILYWNFISIWLLVLLMQKVKKLDY